MDVAFVTDVFPTADLATARPFSLDPRRRAQPPSILASRRPHLPILHSFSAGPAPTPPTIPADLPSALSELTAALTRAVSADETQILIDVLAPDLDPRSRSYDRSALFATASAVLHTIPAPPPSSAPAALVCDGPSTAAAAAAASRSPSFPALAQCPIHTLDDPYAQEAAGNVPAYADGRAVVFLAPTATHVLEARAAIRGVREKGGLQVVVNHGLRMGSAGVPVELTSFVQGFYLEPFAVVPKVGGRDLPPLRMALYSRYLEPWFLYTYDEGEEVYRSIKSFPSKPSEKQMKSACQNELQRRAQ